ncbi:MAG: fluoride efflux transporter CrcB [Limisphaerales bacterium]
MNIAYLWVALGGALGSVGRFWLASFIITRFGENFPLGTLVINVTGSFIIGILAALGATENSAFASPGFRQFFLVGICGGYTTFSAFSLQTLQLVQRREWLFAGGNILLSVVLCLIAVWLGYLLGTMLNGMKGS